MTDAQSAIADAVENRIAGGLKQAVNDAGADIEEDVLDGRAAVYADQFGGFVADQFALEVQQAFVQSNDGGDDGE